MLVVTSSFWWRYWPPTAALIGQPQPSNTVPVRLAPKSSMLFFAVHQVVSKMKSCAAAEARSWPNRLIGAHPGKAPGATSVTRQTMLPVAGSRTASAAAKKFAELTLLIEL